MSAFYKKINIGYSNEYWSFGTTDYPKYIREEYSYNILYNQFTESEVQALGASTITETEFNAYFSAVGSHPPAPPR